MRARVHPPTTTPMILGMPLLHTEVVGMSSLAAVRSPRAKSPSTARAFLPVPRRFSFKEVPGPPGCGSLRTKSMTHCKPRRA
jgi:hypothetical protein